MNTYPEKLDRVLETFDGITDQEDRAALLIDYAERFREVPLHIASRPFPESNRVPFCESEAYVWAVQQPDETLKFYFAVENPRVSRPGHLLLS